MTSSEPRLFRVLWGDPFKGVDQEIVLAFDTDEALVRARDARPEFSPPRTTYEVHQYLR